METPGTSIGSIATEKTMVYGFPFQRRYNQAGSVMVAQVDWPSWTSTSSRGRLRQAAKAAACAGVPLGRKTPLGQGRPDLNRLTAVVALRAAVTCGRAGAALAFVAPKTPAAQAMLITAARRARLRAAGLRPGARCVTPACLLLLTPLRTTMAVRLAGQPRPHLSLYVIFTLRFRNRPRSRW